MGNVASNRSRVEFFRREAEGLINPNSKEKPDKKSG
jgi:hypothetical protein